MHSKNWFSSISELYQQIRIKDDVRKKVKKDSQENLRSQAEQIRKESLRNTLESQESVRICVEKIKKECLHNTFTLKNYLIFDSANAKTSLTCNNQLESKKDDTKNNLSFDSEIERTNLNCSNQLESKKDELTIEKFNLATKNISDVHRKILLTIKKRVNKPFEYIKWNTTNLFGKLENVPKISDLHRTSAWRSKNTLVEKELLEFEEKPNKNYRVALTELGFVIAEWLEDLPEIDFAKFKEYFLKQFHSEDRKITFTILKKVFTAFKKLE